jgi:hypothetical protein
MTLIETLIVVLLILWLAGVGFGGLYVGGGLIHLLLIVVVILVIVRLLTGRTV